MINQLTSTKNINRLQMMVEVEIITNMVECFSGSKLSMLRDLNLIYL